MLFVATSTTADGSMKSPDMDYRTVLPARRSFLHTHGIDASDTTLVQVTYETSDFCRYETLGNDDKGDGITRPPTYEADALVVTQAGHALLLPLADCIGAVIHDPQRNILMLSHLGRQNLEQLSGTKCIEYLIDKHGCDPQTLAVWLSPAAGADSYPLYAFENRSMHDVASEQLQAGGIPATNITISPIDSAADTNYFSHSQYLRGHRKTDGRHGVVAYIA
jgi:copper oxidase (laccase) domain-containing protein